MVVISNYKFRTDNGGTSPSKSTPFTPSSILFRPHWPPFSGGEMVEAPGTAPGSERFITMTVYRHSSCEHSLYRPDRAGLKEGRGKFVPLPTFSADQIGFFRRY